MKTSNKKPFGRPRGRAYGGETIPVRLAPQMVGQLDRWAANSGVSRSEAIRRLLEQALASQAKRRR
jgi:metal-responsive CopG/Arc/MetJ family transcriptional regulator